MTIDKRKEIIAQINVLLSKLIEEDEPAPQTISVTDKPIEMLTIKECTEAIKEISEHTIRQLVTQKKIPYIRTGQGKRGKIFISKKALTDYLDGTA